MATSIHPRTPVVVCLVHTTTIGQQVTIDRQRRSDTRSYASAALRDPSPNAGEHDVLVVQSTEWARIQGGMHKAVTRENEWGATRHEAVKISAHHSYRLI